METKNGQEHKFSRNIYGAQKKSREEKQGHSNRAFAGILQLLKKDAIFHVVADRISSTYAR